METPKGFEWDDDKRRRNLSKHGIDFDDAKEVSTDLSPFANQIATTRSVGSP